MALFNSKKNRFTNWLEQLSPILIKPALTSFTISFSKRFFLFQLLKSISQKIEDEPYLNFISALKYYKVLGRFLHGTIGEMYRDRNNPYFKAFFADRSLYEIVKADIEWVYERNNHLKMTLTKNGIIIYDNYKPNTFNTLLLTIHSGSWMPKDIARKQLLSEKERLLEEDIDTHKIYGGLILEKNGIWIDSKLSRFACDFNRGQERAIYYNGSEEWLDILWKEALTPQQKKFIIDGYDEFYFTLSKLIDTYRFNIILDGHSMKHEVGRPEISFGTDFIPSFYLPVVNSMKRKMLRLGYKEVLSNTPFGGGYITEWLHQQFADVFILSMEINKNLYTKTDRSQTDNNKLEKLAQNVLSIFDIDSEEDTASSAVLEPLGTSVL